MDDVEMIAGGRASGGLTTLTSRYTSTVVQTVVQTRYIKPSNNFTTKLGGTDGHEGVEEDRPEITPFRRMQSPRRQ